MSRKILIQNSKKVINNIIIIPARGGSEGVYRKNLRLIYGKPLIEYSINTALNTPNIDLVAVSTEDIQIASICRDFGVEIINRPSELATNEVSLPEVIKHAKFFFEEKGICPERYISLQPTSPLINSKSLTEAISLHKETKCDSVVSITESNSGHPYWVKSLDLETYKVSNFLDVDVHKYPQRQDLPKCYMYSGGFYIRKTELLKESKGFYLGNDIRGYLLSSEESLDINTEEDLGYFEYLIAKNLK